MSVTPSKVTALVNALTSKFAAINHTHSGYVSATKVTSWSSTVSDDNVASEKLIKDTLDTKQATLVSGTNIKTINNNSLLGSGNITISGGGGGSDGEYFFTKDSFFDPNQWTGSPTISNGTITLTSDATFPLRLPPNCTLTFDLTVSSGYEEYVSALGTPYLTYLEYSAGYNVYDMAFTCSNNACVFSSEQSGDEVNISNVTSQTGLSIPVTSGSTATITNVKYRNKETEEIYDLIGNAITYINGSGS